MQSVASEYQEAKLVDEFAMGVNAKGGFPRPHILATILTRVVGVFYIVPEIVFGAPGLVIFIWGFMSRTYQYRELQQLAGGACACRSTHSLAEEEGDAELLMSWVLSRIGHQRGINFYSMGFNAISEYDLSPRSMSHCDSGATNI